MFPDSNLAEVVRGTLQKPNVSTTVTQDELNAVEMLDELYITEYIASIEGVQYLNNLKLLKIVGYGNSISDLHPLSGLMKLELIQFNSNQISNLSPLSNLTNLSVLILSDNKISDLSPLSGLTNLKKLQLSENQLSDLTPLSGLTNLTFLDMNKNKISDISPLANLTNLTNLNMSNNQITNLSALSGLINLVNLYLSENQISDISPLANLTNLTNLSMSNNQITNLSALSGLINLVNLYLFNNQINNIDSLSRLTNLNRLSMIDNQINDISSLAGLSNLTELDIRGNQIKDVSPLSSLTNLESLLLNSNQISDISSLKNLKNLYSFMATNQTIVNKPVNYQKNLVLLNNIIDRTGTLVSPNGISDNGSYTSPDIIWNLPDYKKQVSYTFSIGDVESPFSGTVIQSLTEAPVSYKVVFDVEGAQTSETTAKDTFLTPPANPVKEGYTFTGWYDEKTGGIAWDFAMDKMPAKDITLYAQFSENLYTATLDVDGKTTSQTVAYQHQVQAPTDPTKEGYTFIGWYDEKTGGTEWDFATDKMPAKDITLYAQFSKNSSDEGTPGDKGQDGETGGKDGTTDKPTESDLQPVDKPTNNSPQLKDTQSTLSVKAKHVSGSKEQGAKEKSSLPATGDDSSFTLYLQATGVLFLVAFFWISHKRKKVRNEK
ncbi:leucine-rich repeat domain-containing protein [Listeria innocua]|uniref:leucine-rich repeat domain-containing protein n=1 Tax=Listeria innocua TaxID=1642 RepID=UPI0035DDF0B3